MKGYNSKADLPGSPRRQAHFPLPTYNLDMFLPLPSLESAMEILLITPQTEIRNLNDIIQRISRVRSGRCRFRLEQEEALPDFKIRPYPLFSAINYVVFDSIRKDEPGNMLLKTSLQQDSQALDIFRDGLPFLPSTLESLNENYALGKRLSARPNHHGGTEIGYVIGQYGGSITVENLSLEDRLGARYSACHHITLPREI